MIVIYNRSVKSSLKSLFESVWGIFVILFVLTMILIFQALLGMLLLNDTEGKFSSKPTFDMVRLNIPDLLTLKNYHNFDSFFVILQQIFISITTDNYPNLS